MQAIECPHCKKIILVETEAVYNKILVNCDKYDKGCGKDFVAEIVYEPKITYFKIKEEKNND